MLGIGLNVALRPDDFPEELRATAATLGLEPRDVEASSSACSRRSSARSRSSRRRCSTPGARATRCPAARSRGRTARAAPAGSTATGGSSWRCRRGRTALDAGEVHLRLATRWSRRRRRGRSALGAGEECLARLFAARAGGGCGLGRSTRRRRGRVVPGRSGLGARRARCCPAPRRGTTARAAGVRRRGFGASSEPASRPRSRRPSSAAAARLRRLRRRAARRAVGGCGVVAAFVARRRRASRLGAASGRGLRSAAFVVRRGALEPRRAPPRRLARVDAPRPSRRGGRPARRGFGAPRAA